MGKTTTSRPVLVMLYGFPGAGKTHFARELCEVINAAHVHGDRIRSEIFQTPRRDKQEDQIIDHLMGYMTGEFLNAGISVVYDTNATRVNERRILREIARKSKAEPVLVWLQIDPDSAMARLSIRDRRKADDKYSVDYTRDLFIEIAKRMQNPSEGEEPVVISGKHTFNTQKSAIMKRLYELGVLKMESVSANVTKPGLVNLIPNINAGRVDMSRRNISIH